MTNGSSDRLNQIEALLLETTQLARSNAKSIQGLADRIAELTHVQEDAAEEREELRQATKALLICSVPLMKTDQRSSEN